MLLKIKLFFLFLIFLNLGSISSVCIPGDNCPTYSGFCKADICECLYGYQTLIKHQTNNPIYCNYKQTSKWIPFVLELFIPSIGLFYLGRIFHGIFKLILFLPLIWKGKEISLYWFFLFFILYLVDLVCLFFRLYSDGNGIALV